jgi:CDP-paratose 2-epimerase
MMNVLVTGGCGFIGCNTAARFMSLGDSVVAFDNLSRPGSARNLEWLRALGPIEFVQGDVRDASRVNTLVSRRFDVVIHLAAQVAVTTSIEDPRSDFEHNALGTLNVLEALRLHSPGTILVNASTNKVYGRLANIAVDERERRFFFGNLRCGVTESQPLQYYSPYGCSKGAADQYVEDYARIYGLRTINFRQSFIYGSRQFEMEDQGWVAWFLFAHLTGAPISVFGNGKQVRDMLNVEDLVDCYRAAIERVDTVSGSTFNVGGGAQNTLSILELFEWIEVTSGRPVVFQFKPTRRGDQPIYVSDITKAKMTLGWQPRVGLKEGLDRLYQ